MLCFLETSVLRFALLPYFRRAKTVVKTFFQSSYYTISPYKKMRTIANYMVPLPSSRGRSTRYSYRLHDFSVTIPRWYKSVYVNSFFPRTARPWHSPPIECFPLRYVLSGFKSRNKSLELPVCFNIFILFFLVFPCLVVAVQPCMEWNPIKKSTDTATWLNNK